MDIQLNAADESCEDVVNRGDNEREDKPEAPVQNREEDHGPDTKNGSNAWDVTAVASGGRPGRPPTTTVVPQWVGTTPFVRSQNSVSTMLWPSGTVSPYAAAALLMPP